MSRKNGKSENQPYPEQIFEMRFEANPLVLDKRGDLAKMLSKSLRLPHWQIGKDRIDVFNDSKTERVFLSHANAGYTSTYLH